MNDFDYDALKKKQVAQGAKHMKKRRKGCKLPTDNMTNKQIEKMHGEVISVNLNKPITYEEYKKLSKDTAELYLNTLAERFCVGSGVVSKEMFGLGPNTLYEYNKRKGIKTNKLTCKKRTNPQKKAWEEFLKGDENIGKSYIFDKNDIVKTSSNFDLRRASFVFTNVTNFDDVSNFVKHYIPKGATITITLEE